MIGYQLARMAHSRHRFVALEEGALANLLPMTERMVSLTDGMYTSDGFTEVLALQAFEQSDFSVLLRGHLGELAKASTAYPFHTDSQVNAMSSREGLVPYLVARLESINHGSSARELFTDEWQEAYDEDAARRSVDTALDGVDLTPPDLCTYLYLHEYHPAPHRAVTRDIQGSRRGPPAARGSGLHRVRFSGSAAPGEAARRSTSRWSGASIPRTCACAIPIQARLPAPGRCRSSCSTS